MRSLQKQTDNRIAEGSLQDIANKSRTSLAESFINCDVIVVCDTSASMNSMDVPQSEIGLTTRYRAMCLQLEKLQNELPGKFAVISFSSHAEFCPSGFPRMIGSMTAMDKALNFVKPADGCGMRLFLISDGEPDNAEAALRIARTFESKIDCIYVGPDEDDGADFLRQLAAATGGISTSHEAADLNDLSKTVRLLLTA